MTDITVFYKDNPNDYQNATLCYLKRKNPDGTYEYLLGLHSKQGKWNGFGGKVGDKEEFKDESIEQAVIREGLEEFSIKIINPIRVGELLFEFCDEKDEIIKRILCHLFVSENYEGEICGSEEISEPTWFSLKTMPWEDMWPNDRIWVEKLSSLSENNFLKAEIKFNYNDPVSELISIEEIKNEL